MDGVNFQQPQPSLLLKPDRPVGIIGYGAYVPRYRLPATQVAAVWGGNEEGLPIKEKAVAGHDEDVITMSIEAARNALKRAGISPWICGRYGLVLNRIPMPSNPPRPLWRKPLAHPPASRRAIGNLPVKQAPKPGSSHGYGRFRHGALHPGNWHGYRPGRPAMHSNIPPGRVAQPIF
jgi:hypothetical protein